MNIKTSYTILAVDDSPENLDLIRSILEPHYTVKVAVQGGLALHIATSQQPDLILLDIMLDDIDGYEICRQLKSSDKTRDIPIIFLTSKRNEEDEVLGFQIGGSDYITKPFSPQIVLARVKTHIELKTKTDLLGKLASLDGLTELSNRRAFDAAITRQWNQASRTTMPLSLLMLDIDRFKQYNDYYGHPAGDECLKQLASALRQNTQRAEDMIARLGGEEFAVLLPHTDTTGALLLAEQYRQAIEALKIPHLHGHPLPFVSISVGVATLQGHNYHSTSELLQAADDALYQAKSRGRNQVCLSGYPSLPEQPSSTESVYN